MLDWDTTDVHSTSFSDGSTFVADYHGRCLRRALDRKVRKLRTMVTANEDITMELDRVVCRLMKLALRSSSGRQAPPPARWMQCKLFDLLTLTEKAIQRRKKYFLDNYPLKAIGYGDGEIHGDMLVLNKIRADNTAKVIMDKYHHLIQLPDDTIENKDDLSNKKYNYDWELEDDLSSNEFLKDIEFTNDIKHSSPFDDECRTGKKNNKPDKLSRKDVVQLERTQAWINEDIEEVSYPNHNTTFGIVSSGDTDYNISKGTRSKYKKSHKKHKSHNKTDELDANCEKLCKRSVSKNFDGKHRKIKHDDRNKNKSKATNTKLIRKLARKNSSYSSFVKNYSQKVASAEYNKEEIKISQKNIKDHQNLQSTASKPIPESLIELCNSEIDIESITDKNNYCNNVSQCQQQYHQPIGNVSATEESLLIDIVMDGMEETIALRRTIGTDADLDPTDFEHETVLGSVVNIETDESFCNKNKTGNVPSHTIFLYDINEPTTSKGIRHVSMDVQCGPDTMEPDYSMLSVNTSQTKMTKMFATGIKIGDSFTNFTANKKSSDFGTCTNANENFRIITPRMKSVGIKIRNSYTDICNSVECSKVDCSTSIQQVVAGVSNKIEKVNPNPPVPVSSPQNFPVTVETKLIKPISSGMKMEDSGSELYGSVGSLLKSTNFMNSSKNPSDIQINTFISNEVEDVRRYPAMKYPYVRPKLSHGGVHIHSFRDRQISEDIVFQGEWQKRGTRVIANKKVYSVTAKKVAESTIKKKKVNSKENIIARKPEKKEIKSDQKKPTQKTNTRFLKAKQESINKMENSKIFVPNSTVPASRSYKNVIKVASKTVVGTTTTKNAKSIHVAKRLPIPAPIINKKENDKSQKYSNKSYIPRYLNKNIRKSNVACKDKLNQSIDSVNTIIKVNKEKPLVQRCSLVRSKTDEIKRDLLKFRNMPQVNTKFVVFRNEIENKNNKAQSEQAKNNANKRCHSPSSQNSSSCSSPNSIVTVRVKSKTFSNRRHSTSSNKSDLLNTESENTTSVRNKKYSKRNKNIKKKEDKDVDNKENIPESSKICNHVAKDTEKIVKSPFTGRSKNIFMAQVTTEGSTINSLSKHKTQNSNKSNVKIPNVESTTDKERLISPSVSKNKSITSDNSLIFKNKSEESDSNSNTVLILEPQAVTDVRDVQDVCKSVPSENDAVVKIVNNSVISEWIDSSNKLVVENHMNSILSAMRQLIEERLSFIDRSSDYIAIDSDTIILSRNNSKIPNNVDDNSSPTSFKTVLLKEDNSIQSNKEDNLNNTLDSSVCNESFISLNDHRLTLADLDLLSFTHNSITTMSRLSEYFLADKDLNIIGSSRTDSLNTNSVRDIFERKDQYKLQNPAGALAIQAFSGFSVNVESIAGDQPDYINLVDSETGSLALEIARQATSEELYLSGRSSASYESCFIHEDAVVPNWLFQIISQQQSEEEVEIPEEMLPVPVVLPVAEPMFDMNENVMEPGAGAGAGAGDGRGMHSDHSQDSSGRGSSLSSSNASSGPRSEAILIDPSAFTGQFSLLRIPTSNSNVVPALAIPYESPDTSFRTAEENETDTLSTSRGDHITRNPINQLMAASDVDADVSSLDTDVPDSSDN